MKSVTLLVGSLQKGLHNANSALRARVTASHGPNINHWSRLLLLSQGPCRLRAFKTIKQISSRNEVPNIFTI
jgi:hypothetical protein